MKERIAIILYVSGSFLIAFVSAFAHNNGIAQLPETIGFAMGTLLIPALIAYAAHGHIGKRPNNSLGFARWLWWSTVVIMVVSNSNYQREHMTTADVHTVIKQAADMTPDSAINNTGQSPEKIEKEAQYRDLMRAYFRQIAEARDGFDNRRAAIDAKMDNIYQPVSYTPARARQIITALNENIALDNDVQAWATNMVPDFQARVKQSRLTDAEQQTTVQGFQRSLAGSPLWPVLREFLATDIELDKLSIQFYQDIGKGNTKRAKSYIDRIQALGKKDTELASQVSRLRVASVKQAGLDGSEQIFQKTPVQ